MPVLVPVPVPVPVPCAVLHCRSEACINMIPNGDGKLNGTHFMAIIC